MTTVRCFWRASTHPDLEMAKTGKRQREVGGGGGGGSSKKAGRGSGQTLGGGGAGAGPELPGACLSFRHHSKRDVDCSGVWAGVWRGRLQELVTVTWRIVETDGDIDNVIASCRRDAGVGREMGLEAARRQRRRRQEESTG